MSMRQPKGSVFWERMAKMYASVATMNKDCKSMQQAWEVMVDYGIAMARMAHK